MTASRSTTKANKAPTASKRTTRPDGAATRAHIIEIAGQLFAESGYEGTTSKAICEKSLTNIAAVNYHFGSRSGLYATVLVEAHSRFISFKTLLNITESKLSARAKLERIIEGLLDGMEKGGWHLRVFIREVISPSPFIETMLSKEVLPKMALMKKLLSDITGISEKDPALARCLLTSIAPCAILLIANRDNVSRVMGDFWKDKPALKAHIITVLFAGLDAMSKKNVSGQ